MRTIVFSQLKSVLYFTCLCSFSSLVPLQVFASEGNSILIKNYENKLKDNPSDVETLLKIGIVYSEKNELTKAYDYLGRARRLAPQNQNVSKEYAYVALRIDKGKEAKDIYTALAAQGDDDVVLFNLGTIALSEKKSDEALRYFRRAVTSNPANISALFAAGEVLYKNNQYKEAEVFFNKVLKINRNAVLAHLRIAQMFQKLDQKENAIKSYKALIAVASNDMTTWGPQIEYAKNQVAIVSVQRSK